MNFFRFRKIYEQSTDYNAYDIGFTIKTPAIIPQSSPIPYEEDPLRVAFPIWNRDVT